MITEAQRNGEGGFKVVEALRDMSY